jgi:hypothetical protein
MDSAEHFIWDVFQQYQIHKLNKTFDAAKDVIAQRQAGQQATLGQIEERMDRLALICRAMLELLEERTGLTDEDLVKKIAEVDSRDGKADGRMIPMAKPCPSCESMISPRFNRCLFCGHKDTSGDPFNVVK